MAAYPLAIGFTTAVRTGRMSVVSGRPPVLATSPPSGRGLPSPPPPPSDVPDLWVTTDVHTMSMTVMAFLSVLVAHLILLAHILMKRPTGASEMKKSYAVAAPVVMCLITVTYYISYLGLTRYGASMGEWMIFTTFSAILILMSIVLYVAPVRQSNLVSVAAA